MRNVSWVLLSLGLLLLSGLFVAQKVRQDPAASPRPSGIPSTAERILTLESRIRRAPESMERRLELAQVLLQSVRETADVALYARVEDILAEVERRDPTRVELLATRAAIAFGQHRFRDAKRLAEEAIRREPNVALHAGLLGDAEIELGHYPEAVEAYQRMVDLRPNLSAYHRIAYARELHGDIAGAEEALHAAINASSPYPENIAWTAVLLGNLALRSDPDLAARAYERARALIPDYPPALAGLGRVAIVKGDLRGALALFEKALARLPLAEYAVALGDTYLRLGERENAQTYFALAHAAFEKSQGGGVNTDLEVAFFLADHEQDLPAALEKAEAAYRDRPSIHAADVLAWTLHKNGQHERATQIIHEALRLGEHDPVIVFHAAMIADAAGNHGDAQRLFKKARSLSRHIAILYDPIVDEKARLAPP